MNPTIELGPPEARYLIRDPGGGGRVAKMLRGGNPYEHAVLKDMKSLEPTGLAVDVGANIANHTLWLAMVCGMDVVAFEPRESARVKFRDNVALNDLEDRVTLHSMALGDRDQAEQATASHVGKGRMQVGAGDIPVRTLDSFELQDVGLLKIDVEGMEQAVIRGGIEMITREKPIIYAEAWDDEYREATGELLRPLGYTAGPKLRWHQQRWDPT